MKHIQITTPDTVIEHVANAILLRLKQGKKVAWLLSGGSAIELEVRIAQILQTHDVSNLFVGLIDERYGPPGHKDENHLQLMEAHFPLYVDRVLLGESGEKTAKQFGESIKKALNRADFSLGIFGIGADGHTAGIKPNSPATTSTDPAIFYEWDDHKRITLTSSTIHQLDEAIIYAIGDEKSTTLRTLIQKDAPINDQPAQVLKGIKTCTLFTDIDLHSTK